MSKKRVVISAGDPAGCGHFITLEALKNCKVEDADFFVVGDKKIFEKYPSYKQVKDKINLVDLKTPKIDKIKKGEISKFTGAATLNYLNEALMLLKDSRTKRLVTAPLSKEAVSLIHSNFSGHTEYLAAYYRVNNFAMMMASKSLKVVLLSRHISLRDVPFRLNSQNIFDNLCLVYASLKRQFKIKNPKIVFTSVNPHAGINTFLESEEKRIVKAKAKFNQETYGPYPADTLFTKENLKKYDCILCAYHDQGMIPFKMLSFYDGVNVTLGLPIIRTSPAHGTAFDLLKAGKKPFSSSMEAAIETALKLSI